MRGASPLAGADQTAVVIAEGAEESQESRKSQRYEECREPQES
jgi:hypothetical protein